MQQRRALLNTKDLQPFVMHESLRSCLHPTELASRERAASSKAALQCCSAESSRQSPLKIPQSQSGTTVLLFRLLFINTDSALPFHICTLVRQLTHKPVKNEYEHATHNYDINDTPNRGTKSSSKKDT